MAYELRDRKQKQVLYIDDTSSSSDDSDHGGESDTDYVKRRPQRNLISSTNNDVVREIVLVAKIAGYSPMKRKPGRPPKAKASASNSVCALSQIQGPLVTKKRSQKRRAAVASSSSSYSGLEKGYVVEDGMEKNTILAMLIDMKEIKDNEEVHYLDMDLKKINSGKVTRAGIHCGCCEKMVTVGKFEEHSYKNSSSCNKSGILGKPYQNIVLERSGHSLLQYQVSVWYTRLERGDMDVVNNVVPKNNDGDKNDDACMVCADGGDLICCEKCPSTFHPSCLEMEGVPFGEWSCPYCVCKYCGIPTGEDLGIDFSKCMLCDKTYHWACYEQKELNLNNNTSPQFCGDGCYNVYEKLQRIVGVKNEMEEGLSWTLIRHADLMSFDIKDIEFFYEFMECNAKIAIAWSLLDQSFENIIDRYTGINLLRSVVYNARSNLSRINFRNFYTAILEKDDNIIVVASIRIHGKKMAEIPFVTTAKDYRGRGMMRKLMVAIESTLCDLEVENVVIPSSSGVEKMWINNFYYSKKIDKSLEKHIQ
ncbi:hypothetical protein G4B88_014639 [Cannabis sativa]|uniref:Uncharacterized protein n=1 Tax=Cannabis sativa TaxID=3483 RepID=A0A7J6I9D9_CANSA|nr:hypothetical protein G4B88_014639 [Cannabis sativa]